MDPFAITSLLGAASPEALTLFSTQALIAFVTLTILEIVLGIDNIIFISALSDNLPKAQQQRARTLGLSLAMILRIVLLLSIGWIMNLKTPVPYLGEWLMPLMGADA